jgi:hypothetical protein
MADTVVELIEEWQTGALFVFVSVLVGVVAAASLGRFGPLYGLGGLIGGCLLTFLTLSYLLYGR